MKNDYSDFSELEREFELEMESAGAGDDGLDLEFEGDFELEVDDEYRDDMEVAFEQDEEETSFEGDYGDDRAQEFIERFMEIGGRQFESSAGVDEAMNEVLDDIEREYFFGALKRSLKKLGKNKLLMSLAKKGLKLGVNKFFPGLQGALQLARGNVKGALLNFGKQALGSVVPGGGAILDSVKAIGLGQSGERERESWENYVALSREAYEHLADNLTPNVDQPAEALRVANNAMQHAIAKARTRAAGGGRGGGGGGRVVRLRVAPGERIKLVITGA